MEGAELCVLMLAICLSGTVIYSNASPLSAFPDTGRSFLMGSAIAGVTFLIIRSPFGRRTGAHFNPALTLTYFFLDRIHHWDAMFYILSQFIGAVTGVFISHEVLGERLSAPPVCHLITVPGNYGNAVAFPCRISFVRNTDGSHIVYNKPSASCQRHSVLCSPDNRLLLWFLLITVRLQRKPGALILFRLLCVSLGGDMDLLPWTKFWHAHSRSRLCPNQRKNIKSTVRKSSTI